MFCQHRKHAIVDYVTQSPNLSEHKFHAGSRRQASHDDLMGGGTSTRRAAQGTVEPVQEDAYGTARPRLHVSY